MKLSLILWYLYTIAWDFGNFGKYIEIATSEINVDIHTNIIHIAI